MPKPIPRGSSSPDPGLGGAIKDAIAAIAHAVAPKSITQRKAKIDQTVEDAETGADDTVDEEKLGRMKAAQSSDKDNSYAF